MKYFHQLLLKTILAKQIPVLESLLLVLFTQNVSTSLTMPPLSIYLFIIPGIANEVSSVEAS